MGDLSTVSIVLIIVSIISIIAWIIALVHAIKSEFKTDNEKIVWIIVILLGGVVGAILYYLIGKRSRRSSS